MNKNKPPTAIRKIEQNQKGDRINKKVDKFQNVKKRGLEKCLLA